MNDLELDERLQADTFPVTELPLCRVLLMDDVRFPWIILVPRRPAVREVFELCEEDQRQLWREATAIGEVMKADCHGDKLNIATLGNVVEQLHVHVVIRRKDDAAWPAPVWGQGSAEPYGKNGLAAMRDHLLAQIEGLQLDSQPS
ncbi:HIT domain-containing protein [Halomonas sp. ZH2S]|uniref:HIT domain-containing protein n=1 Tax=Vreelandella zhuhanensis TaxID=2684210 RepID=A0A7X3H2W2_9GAMM|nr:HIT domain-containing protein [Halomonas zhuhanensis]MWJ28658.1 HIT domain-containing protein [Halomonas zhuhanensis]